MRYKEKFKLSYENQNKRIVEKTEKYMCNGLSDNPINVLTSTSSNLEILAVGELVFNEDVKKMAEYYYNASKLYLNAMKYYDLYPDEKNSSVVSMLAHSKLYDALISESEELITDFAMLMGGRGDIDKSETSDFTYHYGYALKYLAIGEHIEAKKHIDVICESDRKAFVNCLESIVEKDTDKANESLKEIIRWFATKGINKNTHHELFNKTVVGLAKLCKRNGVEITIDDETAPLYVINFSKVDFLVFDIVKLADKLT